MRKFTFIQRVRLAIRLFRALDLNGYGHTYVCEHNPLRAGGVRLYRKAIDYGSGSGVGHPMQAPADAGKLRF